VARKRRAILLRATAHVQAAGEAAGVSCGRARGGLGLAGSATDECCPRNRPDRVPPQASQTSLRQTLSRSTSTDTTTTDTTSDDACSAILTPLSSAGGSGSWTRINRRRCRLPSRRFRRGRVAETAVKRSSASHGAGTQRAYSVFSPAEQARGSPRLVDEDRSRDRPVPSSSRHGDGCLGDTATVSIDTLSTEASDSVVPRVVGSYRMVKTGTYLEDRQGESWNAL